MSSDEKTMINKTVFNILTIFPIELFKLNWYFFVCEPYERLAADPPLWIYKQMSHCT